MKPVKYLLLGILLLTGWGLSSFHTPINPSSDGVIKTIVIDAGHGGKDPGALGTGSKEKEVTLAIALKVKELLNEKLPQMKVILTRDDDTFVELNKRAMHVSENQADFFVSIHCNSSTNHDAFGSETYVLGPHKADANLDVVKRENSAIMMEENYEEVYDGFDPNSDVSYIYFQYITNVHLLESSNLASKIQTQLKDRVGRKDRGVKQAGYLVLWRASKPSLLIETGFISNKEEEKFLKSETGQTYIASAVFRAIRDYNAEKSGQSTKGVTGDN